MTFEVNNGTLDRKQIIKDKFLIWQQLIADSQVSQATKTELLSTLVILRDGSIYESLEDAIYFTVSQLVDIYKKDSNRPEAQALFQNIKDDIWSLLSKS